MNKLKTYQIAIIILNYRTPQLVINCLRSLEGEIYNNDMHIIVVDNNSEDDSVTIIQNFISSNSWANCAEVTSSQNNAGFSAGNNIGISSVNAEFYLLLNSDTLIVKGAIRELLDFSLVNPDVGVTSPSLIWPDGKLQTSAFRNTHPISELLRSAKTNILSRVFKKYATPLSPTDYTTYPDWVCFACVLISRKVIDSIGLLNEKYFMYFEDVDYCRRARKAGFRIANYPKPKVIHLNGGSSGINNKKMAKRRSLPDYYYLSRSMYFKEYYGKLGLIAANLLWYIGRCISLCRELIERKEPTLPKNEFIKIWRDS